MKGVSRIRKGPVMANRAGRKWEAGSVILHEGGVVAGYTDMARGTRFYFQVEGIWYFGMVDRYAWSESRPRIFDLRFPNG